ncbi:alpha/beta fold hydrolase [Actinomadura macrotermitis]|uniref:Tripeptidyl aminopeptidase n=1 Tax=Actinomadura macrotermitis TaxID=2585200 RepID=A0A7K0BP55_9ACTN|nr:Tripeptidyl aminopeptidase [Actinomadura macrotermitis]
MKRIVLLTAAAAVGVGGSVVALTGGTAATASPVAASGIAWGKCPTDVSGAGYLKNAECAQVQVPLDYRHPTGRKISVAVSRVKATDRAHYRGVLLANPGGPGGAGLYLSGGLSSWLPEKVAAKYDVIGFDPRGVESSKPALTCVPKYSDPVRPDYVPRTAKDEKRWLAKSKAYADACAKKFGWLLPHMRTENVARDVDAIRAALGAPQISYYGFSYGTYLGSAYASMFPKRVKRMVLDGNVDTREVWYQGQLNQNVAFERNIKLWFAWVAKYDKLYHLGTTGKAVEARYYKILAQARKKPIGGKVGPAELTDIILNAGYNTGYYIPFAQALSAWATKGDAKPLVDEVSEGGGDNGFAVYNAVQAVDAPWPAKWKTWHRDAARQYRDGIRFNTWGNVWFNAPIHYWHAKAGRPLAISGKGKNLPPILLVQGTLDAATPWSGGPQMRSLFPSARLLAEIGGKTHANTLNGNTCLDDKVAAYLDGGKLWARKPGRVADASCKALPRLNDPDPYAMKAAAAPSGKDIQVGRP